MKDKQANGVETIVNDLMYSNMQTQMVYRCSPPSVHKY